MLPQALTFEQEVWLRLITALSTALLVTLGAGVVTLVVQRRLERSKADRERELDQRWADRERELDERFADRDRSLDERWKTSEREAEAQRREAEYLRDLNREERALRRELVRGAAETLGGFYFATQSYWRQRQNPDIWGPQDGGRLDEAYVAWAKSADVFERHVATVFGWDSEPWQLVHQIRDLLTVRFFNLRGRDTEPLRANNEKGKDGALHSGLTAAELKNMRTVLATYRSCMKSVVDQILTAEVVETWPTQVRSTTAG